MTEDLNTRKVVWEALSTLFLDGNVASLRPYRASILAESPYSLEELEQILSDEVFPVCSWNLASAAGEWIGFDPEWLETKILQRLDKRRRFRIGFGHRLILRSREWRRTKAAVEALRNWGTAEQAGAADAAQGPRG